MIAARTCDAYLLQFHENIRQNLLELERKVLSVCGDAAGSSQSSATTVDDISAHFHSLKASCQKHSDDEENTVLFLHSKRLLLNVCSFRYFLGWKDG
jgi:hypothetical protein